MAGIEYRLVVQWPSTDILPSQVVCGTASEAWRRREVLRRGKMKVVAVEMGNGAERKWISLHQLKRLAEAERSEKPAARTRRRGSWTGAVLGIVMSVLTNDFADVDAMAAMELEMRHGSPGGRVAGHC